MAALKLKTVFRPDGHTAALKDGTVKPRTFEIEYEDVPVLIQAFRRMVRGLEFDICEMAITTYICAKAYGKRFTAIPVFPARVFHHGAILYNTKAGIRNPKDLEGKKVGVHRGYTVTTGVWIRSILQHEYGVDLSKITWLLSGDEHVAEYRPPANVMPIEIVLIRARIGNVFITRCVVLLLSEKAKRASQKGSFLEQTFRGLPFCRWRMGGRRASSSRGSRHSQPPASRLALQVQSPRRRRYCCCGFFSRLSSSSSSLS